MQCVGELQADSQDIKGSIVEFCGDQDGSRFIQQKLENQADENRKLILEEIEPNIYALMSDVFGNYVIQKLFEVCNQQEKAMLGSKMEGNVLQLSSQMYGCRVSDWYLSVSDIETRHD